MSDKALIAREMGDCLCDGTGVYFCHVLHRVEICPNPFCKIKAYKELRRLIKDEDSARAKELCDRQMG